MLSLNFEKFWVGQFRLTPLSPEAGYPLVYLEPRQSVTGKVRLVIENIVVEKQVISWCT